MMTIVALAALVGCTSSSDNGSQAGSLRILAGSEVKDMVSLLEEASKATGVDVELSYTGSIQGAELVASGGAAGKYDAIWFPNNRYLSLLPGADSQTGESVKIMSSPVVLGLAPIVAARLGWDKQAPTWAQIADAAAAGQFTYGMTNPAASNSGFGALVSVATALSGTGSALTVDDIAPVVPELQKFASAQKLTAGSSGWLADQFVDTPGIDGIVNYESVLLGLKEAGTPLTIVTPSDGVMISDYPLTLLAGADEEHKQAFDALTTWLTGPAIQKRIVEQVHRRPAVAGVDTGTQFGDAVLFETPFPNTIDVANTLVMTYLEAVRSPSQEVFVLDISGSMEGERIEALRQALANLAGADTSTLGGFTKFRSGERVTMLPFSNTPGEETVFDIPAQSEGFDYGQITAYVDNLDTDGGTAVYDTLEKAYGIAKQQRAERPNTYVSVVLMTDGENNRGQSFEEFSAKWAKLDAAGIPTFVILFGDANVEEMAQLAQLTGGQTFDAIGGDLAQAFQDIRGYQ